MSLTSKEYDLARCPFCNGHDLTLDVTSSLYQIRCFDCGACGPSTTVSIERAVLEWNEGYDNPSALVSLEHEGVAPVSNRKDKKAITL